MMQPDDTPVVPVAADPDALPRPEEEVADAARAGEPGGPGDGAVRDQPVAGGTDAGPPAQGRGAPDSH